MKSKAQAWGFDLIVAGMLFLSAIAVFYIYSFNYPREGQNTVESLNYEGNLLADNLLTEGFPVAWNETNVVRIGISSENRINDSKLESLYWLTNETLYPGGYELTKTLLNLNYDYFFNFSVAMKVNGSTVQGIGKPLTDADNLIKITRFSIYRNKPVTINIYVGQ